jgi:hypothetical protein
LWQTSRNRTVMYFTRVASISCTKPTIIIHVTRVVSVSWVPRSRISEDLNPTKFDSVLLGDYFPKFRRIVKSNKISSEKKLFLYCLTLNTWIFIVIKFLSHQLMHFLIQLCTSLLSYIKIDHAHNKHNWAIMRNFNQLQVITPWWWILCDPKHVGVFLMCLLDFCIT